MLRLRDLLLILSPMLVVVACGDDDPTTPSNNNSATNNNASNNNTLADPDGGVADAGEDPVDAGTEVMDAGVPDGGADVDAGPPGVEITDLIPETARATCDLLFRCCDASSQESYFARVLQIDGLRAEFESRLPPMAQLDEAGCRQVMTDVFIERPFGPWVSQVTMGNVDYDAQATRLCIETLDNAACGEETTAALNDGTCLDFNPPAGGLAQRSMFSRTSTPGATCNGILDGFGGSFYGTCDPTEAFCCYPVPGEPDACGQTIGEGTCKAVSRQGESCEAVPNVQLCETGLVCGSASSSCLVEPTVDLAIGDTCLDNNEFINLGICQDSYCDTFSLSPVCTAFKGLGESCLFGFECESGQCEIGTGCVENTMPFCVGTSTGT